MNHSSEIQQYYSGKAFKPLLKLGYEKEAGDQLSRWQFLIDHAKNKRVIHLGCLDHESLIRPKIADASWLHGAVTEEASECVGVDIDEEVIQMLQVEYNIDNIVNYDATNQEDLPERLDREWDTILFPDVIEHIPDPVKFLSSLRSGLGQRAKQLVITTPNALCYDNLYLAMNNKEYINSDHISIFTPYTLGKTVTNAGWNVKELKFVNYHPAAKVTGVRSLLRYSALKYRPLLRDTIALVCTVE